VHRQGVARGVGKTGDTDNRAGKDAAGQQFALDLDPLTRPHRPGVGERDIGTHLDSGGVEQLGNQGGLGVIQAEVPAGDRGEA
jgi:hypothetical protein